MSKKLTVEEKAARAAARAEKRRIEKELSRIETEKNQKEVTSITIAIEWKKSRTWGYCPRATAEISFKDGSFERDDSFYASGCGYDKESTVIGQIFNKYMKYKLHENFTEEEEEIPYGVSFRTYDGFLYVSYGQGVGTECYYRVAKFIGGTFKKVASGKSFDVYTYTENN